MVVLAALEAGVIAPIPNMNVLVRLSLIKISLLERRGHGFINAEQSLERSCDI